MLEGTDPLFDGGQHVHLLLLKIEQRLPLRVTRRVDLHMKSHDLHLSFQIDLVVLLRFQAVPRQVVEPVVVTGDARWLERLLLNREFTFSSGSRPIEVDTAR